MANVLWINYIAGFLTNMIRVKAAFADFLFGQVQNCWTAIVQPGNSGPHPGENFGKIKKEVSV